MQREVIIPTLRENHGENIHYEIPLLPDIELHVPADIESPPDFEEDHVDPEDLSREQTHLDRSRARD